MRSNNVSLKILACILIFCTTCGLSCRRKTPPTEVGKPAQGPKEAKVETKAKVEAEGNLVKPAPVAEAGPNSVAVTINGVAITEGEVDKMIAPQLAAMAAQAQDRSPEYIEQMRQILKQQAVERVVAERLIDEKAKQANIVVTEEEIDKQIKEIASTQRPPMSVEDFKKKLEDLGENFDRVKQQIQKGLAFQKLLGAQVEKINVTVEDANKYYQENHSRYDVPEQIRASHILIKTGPSDPNADPNEVKAKAKAAKAKAEDLLKQIKAGADFAELAKANSDCPSAPNGGDLGFFSKGRMVPSFETAAFALGVGQVSDVVETQFGYHIIKVTDHKAAETKTFDQVKDEIIQQLTQRKQRELAGQYIDSLRAEAKIVYPPGKEPEANMSQPAPKPRPMKPAGPNEGNAAAEK